MNGFQESHVWSTGPTVNSRNGNWKCGNFNDRKPSVWENKEFNNHGSKPHYNNHVDKMSRKLSYRKNNHRFENNQKNRHSFSNYMRRSVGSQYSRRSDSNHDPKIRRSEYSSSSDLRPTNSTEAESKGDRFSRKLDKNYTKCRRKSSHTSSSDSRTKTSDKDRIRKNSEDKINCTDRSIENENVDSEIDGTCEKFSNDGCDSKCLGEETKDNIVKHRTPSPEKERSVHSRDSPTTAQDTEEPCEDLDSIKSSEGQEAESDRESLSNESVAENIETPQETPAPVSEPEECDEIKSASHQNEDYEISECEPDSNLPQEEISSNLSDDKECVEENQVADSPQNKDAVEETLVTESNGPKEDIAAVECESLNEIADDINTVGDSEKDQPEPDTMIVNTTENEDENKIDEEGGQDCESMYENETVGRVSGDFDLSLDTDAMLEASNVEKVETMEIDDNVSAEKEAEISEVPESEFSINDLKTSEKQIECDADDSCKTNESVHVDEQKSEINADKDDESNVITSTPQICEKDSSIDSTPDEMECLDSADTKENEVISENFLESTEVITPDTEEISADLVVIKSAGPEKHENTKPVQARKRGSNRSETSFERAKKKLKSDAVKTVSSSRSESAEKSINDSPNKEIQNVNDDRSEVSDTILSEHESIREQVRNISQCDIHTKLKKLSKKELEAYLIQKCIECMVNKSELGKLREQAREANKKLEANKVKLQELNKQVEVFQSVLTKIQFDKQSNGGVYQQPIRPQRTVGLQANWTSEEENILNLRQLLARKNQAAEANLLMMPATTNTLAANDRGEGARFNDPSPSNVARFGPKMPSTNDRTINAATGPATTRATSVSSAVGRSDAARSSNIADPLALDNVTARKKTAKRQIPAKQPNILHQRLDKASMLNKPELNIASHPAMITPDRTAIKSQSPVKSPHLSSSANGNPSALSSPSNVFKSSASRPGLVTLQLIPNSSTLSNYSVLQSSPGLGQSSSSPDSPSTSHSLGTQNSDTSASRANEIIDLTDEVDVVKASSTSDGQLATKSNLPSAEIVKNASVSQLPQIIKIPLQSMSTDAARTTPMIAHIRPPGQPQVHNMLKNLSFNGRSITYMTPNGRPLVFSSSQVVNTTSSVSVIQNSGSNTASTSLNSVQARQISLLSTPNSVSRFVAKRGRPPIRTKQSIPYGSDSTITRLQPIAPASQKVTVPPEIVLS